MSRLEGGLGAASTKTSTRSKPCSWLFLMRFGPVLDRQHAVLSKEETAQSGVKYRLLSVQFPIKRRHPSTRGT